MPNWIEGTLKLRGDPKDIKRFFREGVRQELVDCKGNKTIQVKEETYGNDYSAFSFFEKPYVIGAHRAFITEKWSVYVDNTSKSVVVPLAIEEAWGFLDEAWVRIAKEYNLDIRLQGFECGMQFYQDLIIKADGTIEKNEETKFEDWAWDCPMPNLGG